MGKNICSFEISQSIMFCVKNQLGSLSFGISGNWKLGKKSKYLFLGNFLKEFFEKRSIQSLFLNISFLNSMGLEILKFFNDGNCSWENFISRENY